MVSLLQKLGLCMILELEDTVLSLNVWTINNIDTYFRRCTLCTDYCSKKVSLTTWTMWSERLNHQQHPVALCATWDEGWRTGRAVKKVSMPVLNVFGVSFLPLYEFSSAAWTCWLSMIMFLASLLCVREPFTHLLLTYYLCLACDMRYLHLPRKGGCVKEYTFTCTYVCGCFPWCCGPTYTHPSPSPTTCVYFYLDLKSKLPRL